MVKKNRVLAQDLQEAHNGLVRIAECLRYPPSSFPASDTSETPLTSEQVRGEMEVLLQAFQPDLKRRPAQATSRLPDSWGCSVTSEAVSATLIRFDPWSELAL